MKNILRRIYENSTTLGIDPILLIRRFQGLPYFFKNLKLYRNRQSSNSFIAKWNDLYYASFDRFRTAGAANGHYFWQDLWAARYIYERNTTKHADVGSRIDGFVGHILPFCQVTYVDLRPIDQAINNLSFVQASIIQMPFKSDSILSLSCLHVIEHIRLGRYGDPIDPEGYIKAAHELSRVLAPGGTLLIGTPVGKERLRFDAHRIFDPETIVEIFTPLTLKSLSLIDDSGRFIENSDFKKGRRCQYGCGLFIFQKV